MTGILALLFLVCAGATWFGAKAMREESGAGPHSGLVGLSTIAAGLLSVVLAGMLLTALVAGPAVWVVAVGATLLALRHATRARARNKSRG